MPTYNYLPGVVVNLLDGGLASQFAPKNDAILVIGTAGQGIANQPYQVTDRAVCAKQFGFAGSLERGIEECATYSDNVIAFRAGTKPMGLTNVGKDATTGSITAGFGITFNDVTSDAADRYQVWYKAGVLSVWKDAELQFSNQAGAAVDTGDITITGAIAGNSGMQLGTGTTPTLANSVTVTAAVALVGTTDQHAPTLTAPVDGTGLTGRQKYLALAEAMDLCSGVDAKIVFCPDAVLDQPNVAYSLASGDVNDPATNPDALDWLKVTRDGFGAGVYQWASETKDSSGGTVTAMAAADAAARKTAGFAEVNFGSLLGNFAANLSQVGALSVALIGCSAPASTSLINTRKWVGYLPTYDASNHPVKDGSGLLGIAYLTGCTSTKLNALCSDHAVGFRLPGLYVTADGTYDGEALMDSNDNLEDAGRHLHVVADWGFLSNGYQTNYVQNLAGLAAGYLSALDAATGLTNKPVKATQIWTPSLTQLDALTEAKISVLRYKGPNTQPVLLHDLTAATNASDYTNLVRVRCMGVVVDTLRQRAEGYIGQSSLDGLTLAAMTTQLDQDLMNLTKRGYCNHSSVRVTATAADRKIGHANLTLIVHPADELIQIPANVGIGQ